MKKLLFASFITVLLSSCVTLSYYQVYKAVPSDKTLLKENLFVYEDDNCKVSYNLWAEGGNIGFRFFNKSDKNIYLNLEESFFILNGVANNYYKDRVFSNSTSTGSASSHGAMATKSLTGINYLDLLQTNRISSTSSIGLMSTSGYSVSYNEEKILCIPAMTSKTITEYNINQSLFRDCDLYVYPNKKQIRTKSFAKSTSPLVFSNRIAYTVGKSDNLIKFENEFYIAEISNHPENEIIEIKQEEFCNEKSDLRTKYFKNVSPDKFYVEYKQGQYSMKH